MLFFLLLLPPFPSEHPFDRYFHFKWVHKWILTWSRILTFHMACRLFRDNTFWNVSGIFFLIMSCARAACLLLSVSWSFSRRRIANTNSFLLNGSCKPDYTTLFSAAKNCLEKCTVAAQEAEPKCFKFTITFDEAIKLSFSIRSLELHQNNGASWPMNFQI